MQQRHKAAWRLLLCDALRWRLKATTSLLVLCVFQKTEGVYFSLHSLYFVHKLFWVNSIYNTVANPPIAPHAP